MMINVRLYFHISVAMYETFGDTQMDVGWNSQRLIHLEIINYFFLLHIHRRVLRIVMTYINKKK